jgi:tRNA threonylcarbamoyladenosine biosynthesis protein TsaE
MTPMPDASPVTIVDCPDLAATEAFGRAFAATLGPGDIVALDGPLGAGKTHLVRAIAEGLGIRNPAVVTSPTFVLIQEYDGRIPIYHFDAYRLTSADEFLAIGAMEYLDGDGVCLIEWADRVRTVLPPRTIPMVIEIIDEQRRRMIIQRP